jgi:hypothetical protein
MKERLLQSSPMKYRSRDFEPAEASAQTPSGASDRAAHANSEDYNVDEDGDDVASNEEMQTPPNSAREGSCGSTAEYRSPVPVAVHADADAHNPGVGFGHDGNAEVALGEINHRVVEVKRV